MSFPTFPESMGSEVAGQVSSGKQRLLSEGVAIGRMWGMWGFSWWAVVLVVAMGALFCAPAPQRHTSLLRGVA